EALLKVRHCFALQATSGLAQYHAAYTVSRGSEELCSGLLRAAPVPVTARRPRRSIVDNRLYPECWLASRGRGQGSGAEPERSFRARGGRLSPPTRGRV